MASWNELRDTAKRAATKAINKTSELVDIASMQIKLKSLESKRNTQYQLLGKLTYRQLKSGESQAEKIAPVVAELDTILEQIREQVAEIEAAKKAREERKQAEKEAEATTAEKTTAEEEAE
ncbi:MAG: hypothetical protein IJX94_03860 [Clostridia bacterium]|nr:hypothetical protein [Clostridia bacterium]